MRCSFCHKRLVKKVDTCPYCGMEIKHEQQISSVFSIFLSIIKKFMIGFVLVGLVVACVIIRPYRLINIINLTTNQKESESMTFDEAYHNYFDQSIVTSMIETREGLKRILQQNGYDFIEMTEEFRTNHYLYDSSSLTVTAKKDDYDYKIVITDTQTTTNVSFFVAGVEDILNNQFEIKEDDVKELFDYLKINNGYDFLKEGYDKMIQSHDLKFTLLDHNCYITMNHILYKNSYHFSYLISH